MNMVDQLKERHVANDQDIDRVGRIVSEYPDYPFFMLIEKMHRIMKEVTPVHYMIAGFLSGYVISSKETVNNIQSFNRLN